MDHNSPPEEDGTEAEAVEVVGRRKRKVIDRFMLLHNKFHVQGLRSL